MNPPVLRSHTLSAVEREALVTIRVLRDAAHRPQNSSASLELTVMIHDLIVTYHGHVELRLHVLAQELGTTMRVIERKFEARYGMTMHEFHRLVRVQFAEKVIENDPDFKISALASLLGYRRSSEFSRFFRKHSALKLTPHAYAKQIHPDQRK